MPSRVHSTAIIEPGVVIGDGTAVWDNVHIRRDAVIGDECIIGEKTYIAYGVRIGHRCKINAMVYICAAVTIEDGVMISAGTIFTNDRFPRATTPDLKALRPSDPDEHTLPTLVREGATIGAGCTIGNDLSIGRFAMIGMGSLVTKSIPDFALAIGHPARVVGAICRCGQLMARFDSPLSASERGVRGERSAGARPNLSPQPPLRSAEGEQTLLQCSACNRQYELTNGLVTEREGR